VPGRAGRAGGLDGLAAAGETYVRHRIGILAQEVCMTMHLCCARSIAGLNRGMIRSRQPWPPAGADGCSAAFRKS
jgi:isopentenyl diphosphate isomerase/L-lactate dehydrogenase-like FMN-dependent dehydrogenase